MTAPTRVGGSGEKVASHAQQYAKHVLPGRFRYSRFTGPTGKYVLCVLAYWSAAVVSFSEYVAIDPSGHRTIVALVDLAEGLPSEVLNGLAARRAVAAGEPCPGCGVSLPKLNRAQRRRAQRGPLEVRVEHENACVAVAPAVEAVLRGAR